MTRPVSIAALFSLVLVSSCTSTTLEVLGDDPANPSAASGPSAPSSAVLRNDYDPFVSGGKAREPSESDEMPSMPGMDHGGHHPDAGAP
jgi:hypothetical protein